MNHPWKALLERRKTYPLNTKVYYERDAKGVLTKQMSDTHTCNIPGNYEKYRHEQYDYSGEGRKKYTWDERRYLTGSFWECPECERIYYFVWSRSREWQLIGHWQWIWWRRYHRAQKQSPKPTPEPLEED